MYLGIMMIVIINFFHLDINESLQAVKQESE